jgi:hypothetical protein
MKGQTMARLTMRTINDALPQGFELVKGRGYFYFADDDGDFGTHSVYVYALGHMTREEWMEEFTAAYADYRYDGSDYEANELRQLYGKLNDPAYDRMGS